MKAVTFYCGEVTGVEIFDPYLREDETVTPTTDGPIHEFRKKRFHYARH